MAVMTEAQLSSKDRRALALLLNSSTDARVVKRAIALKQWDDGVPIAHIAKTLQVSRHSIYNWLARALASDQGSLEARLRDGERSGRPSTLKDVIDPLIDGVIDAEPTTYGYQATVWTAPLLKAYLADQHGLVASVQSVRLALRRLRIRWKRPRYTLSLRPKTWRQAKGG
jgi:transposase